MQGLDPGQVALNVIAYFGGAAGGALVLAAVLVSAIMAAIGWAHERRPLHAFYYGAGGWAAAFAVRTWLAWGGA
jgi:hypothetical protein